MNNAQLIDALKGYFSRQAVERVWLFGSVARGEQTDSSDIDLLVDYGAAARPSLFGQIAQTLDLERIVNRRVDLIPNEALDPRVRPFADCDKILVYERSH